MMTPLVSSKWLNENMYLQDLIILDASPISTATGKQSKFENQSISGARHFDIKNSFSDPNSNFPNTFPSIEQFEANCQALGINNSSKLVVYDNLGIHTSPRVRWMFKTMGHENISVLNGGLPNWIENSFDTQSKSTIILEKGNFTCSIVPSNVKYFDFIQAYIKQQDHLIIDARSAGRFNGTSKEPRPELRSGNIPNSINIPYERVLENGSYKSQDELLELFNDILNDKRPLTFSCGSGITACIVQMAAELVLNNPTSIYDGSWTEWATLNLK